MKYVYDGKTSIATAYDENENVVAKMNVKVVDRVALLNIYELNVEKEEDVYGTSFRVMASSTKEVKKLLNEQGIKVNSAKIARFGVIEDAFDEMFKDLDDLSEVTQQKQTSRR